MKETGTMGYTRRQILETIEEIEDNFCTDKGTNMAIAVSCMRECLENRQKRFKTGDILHLGPNQINSDWGIFLKYANENADACIVLTTITKQGYIGAAYWEVNEVEKTGHIDISGIESVLQTGGAGMTAQEKVEQMLMMLEPINREKVHDLPDAPDKNTLYILEQEWIYLEGEWVRMG